MTALLLWLIGAAWALELQIRAEVAPDLASVTGTLQIRGEGWTLVDPLADLPAPLDDRTLLRTAPGALQRGAVTWVEESPGLLRFEARPPRRYGATGALPGRGLWMNGGWHPLVLVDGEIPIADWDVEVTLPEGSAGALAGAAGEGALSWRGRGERVGLAALKRGRVRSLEAEAGRLLLVERGPSRRVRDRHLLAALAESWPLDDPAALVVVESPQLRRLVRSSPELVFLSERAFRMTPPLARYHRPAVARGLLEAGLPIEDPWGRSLAAATFARAYADGESDAQELLRWAAWIPEVEQFLYDGSVPFYGELFNETFPSDPVHDDLLERFNPRTPGQAVAVKLDDRYGPGASLAASAALLRGATLEEAVAASGAPSGFLDGWRAPYPDQDLRLEVAPSGAGWSVAVTRDAPPEAPPEAVIVDVDGERLVWQAPSGPGVQRWDLPERPTRVALDPNQHIRQTDAVNDRWPPRWGATFAAFPSTINLTERTLSGVLSAAVRKRYDTHHLFGGSVYTDPVNLAGARVAYRYAFGPLQDRRTRNNRVTFGASAALLSEDYRPTTDGRYALGVGVTVGRDTRVDWNFPLRGHALSLSASTGFVPGGAQIWTSGRVGAGGVASPHPRHAFAGRVESAFATGSVEHRLLGGGLRALGPGDVVARRRATAAGEYRVAPLRNASVPVWLAWGSELQLHAGAEVGGLGQVILEDASTLDTLGVVGWTGGVGIVGDVLGARPSLLVVSLAGPAWTSAPLELQPIQIRVDWSQAF